MVDILHGTPSDADRNIRVTIESGPKGLYLTSVTAADSERLEDIWREKIIRIFEGNLSYLPKSAIENQ